MRSVERKRAVLRAVMTWMAAVGVVLGASAQSPREWRFGITPSGEPRVLVVLAVVPEEPLVPAATLQHELVFDGIRHFSRIMVAQAETYLVSSGPQRFRWRRLGGGVVEMESGKAARAGGREWTLRTLASGQYRIESSNGEEWHEFRSCLPTRSQLGGQGYAYVTEGGRITAIRRDGVAAPILSMRYVGGRLVRLEVSGRRFSFKHEAGRMKACVDEDSGKAAFECEYSGDLVARVSSARGSLSYEWGNPRVATYFTLPVVVAPFVVGDSRFRYDAAVSETSLDVHFRSKDGVGEGTWRQFHRTGRVELHDTGQRATRGSGANPERLKLPSQAATNGSRPKMP